MPLQPATFLICIPTQHILNTFVENIGLIVVSDALRPISDALRSGYDALRDISDALTLADDALSSKKQSAVSQFSRFDNSCVTLL
jgi:hypothetical protein